MENPTKRPCRRTLDDASISDNVNKRTCALEEVSSYWKDEIKLINLPTEILDIILQNLSYHEISKIREVCRRLRDICNDILNREFCKLKESVEQRRSTIVEEINKLYDTVKTNSSREFKVPKLREQQILKRCRYLLDVIINQLCLLRAICYRFLFLNDISPLICYPRSFFAGKIIDEIHRLIKLVELKSITRKDTNVCALFDLVDIFIDFYHDRIEVAIVNSDAVSSGSTLFGSKVIDLLECCLDCNKNVKRVLDSQDWYHFKGEYKLHRSFFTCFPINHLGFENLEPLTDKEQISLHECLRHLTNRSNECYLREQLYSDENALPVNNILWALEGFFENVIEGDNIAYYSGHFSEFAYLKKFREGDQVNEINGTHNGIELDLTFKVDMKCRKKLAPVEMLLQWMKDSPNEDEGEGEGSTENTDHDLVLRLEIECPAAAMANNRLPPVYRCIIKQRHLPEEQNTVPPEVVIVPLDYTNNRVLSLHRGGVEFV